MQLSHAPFRVVFGAVLLGGSLVSPVHAQPAAGVPSWQVDTNASRIYIKVEAATYLGHSHGVIGNLAAGSVTAAGMGELVFDMRSFSADPPAARQFVGLDPHCAAADAQKATSNMQSSSVLDVAQFPQATFAIHTFAPLDGQQIGDAGRYQVKGSFCLHGVKQPVEFPATLKATGKPGVLHMQGTFSILQTSYNIQPFSAVGGLVRIADSLQIWGELLLVPVTP